MTDLSKLLAIQKAARASAPIPEKKKIVIDFSKLNRSTNPVAPQTPPEPLVDSSAIQTSSVAGELPDSIDPYKVEEVESEEAFYVRKAEEMQNRFGMYDLALETIRDAYREWFNDPKSDKMKESTFMRYLPEHDVAPDNTVNMLRGIAAHAQTENEGYDGTDSLESTPDEYQSGDDEIGTAEPDSLDAARLNILEGLNVIPDESQVRAVHGMATEKLACLIGAAGTGKTTTTRVLLHTLINGDIANGIEPVRLASVDMSQYSASSDETKKKAAKEVIPTIAMVAFTGQATQVLRKNMPKAWHRNCMTIHSLLGYAPVEYAKPDGKPGMRFEPTYTKENKFPWDIICIDESSMVSVELWHQMRDAAKDDCRFYFIGDLNQLPPPIGEGILGFALARLPVFELTHVHRQSDEAANKIIDTAWDVLKGNPLTFDDATTNPNWRVIGLKIDASADKAHQEICSVAMSLSQRRVHKSVNPDQPLIYDPWRDRIMVTMNGDGPVDTPASRIGQVPLNESLSQLFAGKDAVRFIINYKKGTKRFGLNYRVMATKNEPPNKVDRVTNGLTGRILSIHANPDWVGEWRLVGDEKVVAENRKIMLAEALGNDGRESFHLTEDDLGDANEFLDSLKDAKKEADSEERQSGPASHVVEVLFDNGAKRLYNLNAQIEQLNIAYVSTTHKTQGAEMPTAIIVVHHAQRLMLCRENLYTAITRAKERVIILYTDFGLRLAVATQKIRGNNLQEKIQKYIELSGEGGSGFKVMNVRLKWDD